MSHVIRAYDAVVDDIDTVKRSVVARINTASRDRYNTVIAPKGCMSKNWRAAGGPVLWEHGKDVRRGTDPIANGKELWNNGGPMPTELIAQPVFLGDEFAQQRFEWYRDGKVKGWSVNILPVAKSMGPPTREELRARPDWEGVETVYREWDLAEFSGTTVPGQAEAVTVDQATQVMHLVERGLWLPDEARSAYEAAMKRPRTMTESGGLESGGVAVERYIRKKGNKWVVYSESGKVLGEHDSEESARKQLSAIEAHKHAKDRSVEWDGKAWAIIEADGRISATFADESIARHCLELMKAAPLYDHDLARLRGEFRQRQERAAADRLALVELMLFGRV